MSLGLSEKNKKRKTNKVNDKGCGAGGLIFKLPVSVISLFPLNGKIRRASPASQSLLISLPMIRALSRRLDWSEIPSSVVVASSGQEGRADGGCNGEQRGAE